MINHSSLGSSKYRGRRGLIAIFQLHGSSVVDRVMQAHPTWRKIAANDTSACAVYEFDPAWSFQEGRIWGGGLGNPLKGSTANDDVAAADADFLRWLSRITTSNVVQELNALKAETAFMLANAEKGVCVAASDRFGIYSVYYAQFNGALIVSTDPRWIAQVLQTAELNPQAIYDYVYFHVVPGPETIYRDIRRLMPGCALTYDRNGLSILRYFRLKYEGGTADWVEKRADLLRLLEQAVRARSGNKSVGAFLSGGTDSSTITGMLAHMRGSGAKAFSIGFDAPGYDEMEYARTAAHHFGVEHFEYYVTPKDVVDAVPLVAQWHHQPFGNASAVPAYFCAAMARESGVQRMLAGDGGDEIFGGNARYAKQLLFGYYACLPRIVRKALIEPVLLNLPTALRKGMVRKLVRYVEQARMPLFTRLESYNLLERIGAEIVFTRHSLESMDSICPLKLIEEESAHTEGHSDVNRMLDVDMRFVLADSDLPKVNVACAMAGVDVRYPMLDQNLVEFAAGLPPSWKVSGTQLRYFFKESLRGFLPGEIIDKKKQGFGLPFGLWLENDQGLKELTGDSFSSLSTRGIFEKGFLKEFTAAKHREHAAYYGVLIWVLLMLEQWLSADEKHFNYFE